MFSTDKNIETIAELVEKVKKYAGLRFELVKLDVIDKVVRIITALSLTFVIALLMVLMLIYLSFAAAFAIGGLLESNVLGFLAVTAIYFVVLLIVVAKRKAWIERPLVRFLASVLLEN